MTTPPDWNLELACDAHSIPLCVDACDTGFDLGLDIESTLQVMEYWAPCAPKPRDRRIALQKQRGCLQSRPTARIL
jgi:hypothetical protein